MRKHVDIVNARNRELAQSCNSFKSLSRYIANYLCYKKQSFKVSKLSCDVVLVHVDIKREQYILDPFAFNYRAVLRLFSGKRAEVGFSYKRDYLSLYYDEYSFSVYLGL